MKRIFILFILIFIFNSSGFSEIAVINPGFEKNSKDLPLDWSYIGWFKPEVDFSLDGSRFNSGKYSASIKISELTDRLKEFGPPNWAQDIRDNIPAGKMIRLDGYISARGVDGIAIIALQCIDKEGNLAGFATTQYNSPVSGDTDWTKTGFEIRVPDSTVLMRILCMLSGTGQAWFDDVRIICKE